jgi:hypothetical protein
MLLILGNVAKMLGVKSKGACSLTLVSRAAHLLSQSYSGQIHIDYPAIARRLNQDLSSKRPLIVALTKAPRSSCVI